MFGRIYMVTVYGEDETTVENRAVFTSLHKAKKYAEYHYFNIVRLRKLLSPELHSGRTKLLYRKEAISDVLIKDKGERK